MPSLLDQANRLLTSPALTKYTDRYLSPRQSFEAELLDAPDQPKEALAGTFRDLRVINRWFGGWSLVESNLRPFLPPAGQTTRLTLLDLAAGVADVPLALAQRWQKRGLGLRVTVVDLNPTIVELAEEAAHQAGLADFQAIAADVFAYPWPQDHAYDFVTCSLAFHHFSAEQCVRMLELMARLSKRAFVVNDLRRSWFGWLGAHFLTRTITRHPLNRNDAPLSVLRAFTRAELAGLVRQAHFEPGLVVRVKRQPFSRLAIVGEYTTV